MKAKGLRVFAGLIILVGIVAGVAALIIDNCGTMGIIALGLSVAIGVVIACILFAVANNKEKRERIRASMEAVEDASIFDPIEEPVVEDIVFDDEVSEYGDIPEFIPEENTDLIFDPIEEEVEVPKTKYQMVRDFVVEKTPITNEQIDKAEKIGKVAIPVAAVATVVLMAAKLASYRKSEIRRRTFFDWLG
ncbi:MAG: hypothetical protein E7584_07635 [Ruminococcaceae bacterium]|nr:hypothetical protein [Oscillospiraceae bacterium]